MRAEQVSQQLLEFLHKYVSEVVTDAALYQEHAGKPEVDIDDIRLAVQVRAAACAGASAWDGGGMLRGGNSWAEEPGARARLRQRRVGESVDLSD